MHGKLSCMSIFSSSFPAIPFSLQRKVLAGIFLQDSKKNIAINIFQITTLLLAILVEYVLV